MGKIYSISNPESVKSDKEWFDECHQWYPHNPGRRAKAKARTLFMQIIQPGGVDTRSKNADSGGYDVMHLEATPAEILEGVKAFRKGLLPQDSYTPDTRFVPFMQVWLNQGRWED